MSDVLEELKAEKEELKAEKEKLQSLEVGEMRTQAGRAVAVAGGFGL